MTAQTLIGRVEQTNDEYHAGPGISKSHLDAIRFGSPKHYWHKYINPEREPSAPTPAMALGTAIHSAILEPNDFERAYIVSPGFDRRSKAGREAADAFQQANVGKQILSPEDFDICCAVRDAVHRHPVAAGLLAGGKAEQTFYANDPETGELIKCRTDYLHDDWSMIVDVKSTEDASPEGFGKSAANFRYALQPAWYNRVLDASMGSHPPTWVFLAVEKKPPYAIGVYFTEPDQIERAQIAAERDFLTILSCKATGVWPDYGYEPQPLMLPAWSKM